MYAWLKLDSSSCLFDQSEACSLWPLPGWLYHSLSGDSLLRHRGLFLLALSFCPNGLIHWILQKKSHIRNGSGEAGWPGGKRDRKVTARWQVWSPMTVNAHLSRSALEQDAEALPVGCWLTLRSDLSGEMCRCVSQRDMPREKFLISQCVIMSLTAQKCILF